MHNYKAFWQRGDVKFVLTFAVIFFVTFSGLFMLGLVPNELTDKGSLLDDLRFNAIQMAEGQKRVEYVATAEGEEPIRLVIPDAKIDVLVQNPVSKDNTVLNEYLTRGAIRYVDSALPGTGNVLIFGHSSSLNVVQNQAYKALNGLKDLESGDLIYVDSEDSRYTYKLNQVELVKAGEEYIDFSTGKNMLTISTCNTFGAKEDRYVAEAEFVSKTSKI